MPNTKNNKIGHPNNFQSLPITRNRSKGTSKNEMTEKSQESSRIFSKLDKQITKQRDRNSKTPELHNIQIIKLPNKLLDASSQMPRSSENCTTICDVTCSQELLKQLYKDGIDDSLIIEKLHSRGSSTRNLNIKNYYRQYNELSQ